MILFKCNFICIVCVGSLTCDKWTRAIIISYTCAFPAITDSADINMHYIAISIGMLVFTHTNFNGFDSSGKAVLQTTGEWTTGTNQMFLAAF